MTTTRGHLLDLPFRLGPDQAASDEARALVFLLFGRHRDGVLRYARSFGLDAGASEDVVQEVFLALWRHLGRGGDRANLRGWLFRVAHNQALRRRVRDQRRARLSGGTPERALTAVETPEERLAERQRQVRLRSVVRALPARDRRCLQLRAEGLRYREIAEVLGVSVGTVATMLTRALGRLRRADEV